MSDDTLITWHINGGWNLQHDAMRFEDRAPFCYAFRTPEDAARAALAWLAQQDLEAVLRRAYLRGSVPESIGDRQQAIKSGRLQVRLIGPVRFYARDDQIVISAPAEVQVVRFETVTETTVVGDATVTTTTNRPVVVVPWTTGEPWGFGGTTTPIVAEEVLSLRRQVLLFRPAHGRRSFRVSWNQLAKPPAGVDARQYGGSGEEPEHWSCHAVVEAKSHDEALAVAADRVKPEDVSEKVFKWLGNVYCTEIAWQWFEDSKGAA